MAVSFSKTNSSFVDGVLTPALGHFGPSFAVMGWSGALAEDSRMQRPRRRVAGALAASASLPSSVVARGQWSLVDAFLGERLSREKKDRQLPLVEP
jgi:hypothetical protein